MKRIIKSLLIASVSVLALSACKKNKKDDPSPAKPIEVGGGDEENITRVVLIMTNGTMKDTVTYKDSKGDGTNVSIDSLILNSSNSYSVEIKVYNDTKNPIMIVSNEIEEEANFHRFHYTFTSNSGTPSLTTVITDLDTKSPPQPLGLKFNLATGSGIGKGNFKLVLRHFGEGAEKTTNPADGDSDILIEFPVRVK